MDRDPEPAVPGFGRTTSLHTFGPRSFFLALSFSPSTGLSLSLSLSLSLFSRYLSLSLCLSLSPVSRPPLSLSCLSLSPSHSLSLLSLSISLLSQFCCLCVSLYLCQHSPLKTNTGDPSMLNSYENSKTPETEDKARQHCSRVRCLFRDADTRAGTR